MICLLCWLLLLVVGCQQQQLAMAAGSKIRQQEEPADAAIKSTENQKLLGCWRQTGICYMKHVVMGG